MENVILRVLAMAFHFMIFSSAVIVTGITSFFFNDFTFRGVHVEYHEVIATITMVLYLVAMLLPLLNRYRGYFMPVNFIFSYLWLTAFIFAAEDWSTRGCTRAPPGSDKCGLKRTVEAFTFLAFFFLLCNIFVEGLLWWAHRKPDTVVKERPGTGHTEESATPATQG
ncbi:Uncharacterized protein TPAR_02772 [Tolypocladium paradoxum]|uniref:MARVEL domain-containing protein n=1 Tax=Tolypocladium paradoxum TaxID=94208 RepID=A0A2S4L3L1_9HYPO|nr:Uncharacterized protein TPAR_02772 [Tolypocladium paradoxum]